MDKTKLIESLKNQRESIQNDLSCILDGIDDEILNNACQVVVERINIIITEIESDK